MDALGDDAFTDDELDFRSLCRRVADEWWSKPSHHAIEIAAADEFTSGLLIFEAAVASIPLVLWSGASQAQRVAADLLELWSSLSGSDRKLVDPVIEWSFWMSVAMDSLFRCEIEKAVGWYSNAALVAEANGSVSLALRARSGVTTALVLGDDPLGATLLLADALSRVRKHLGFGNQPAVDGALTVAAIDLVSATNDSQLAAQLGDDLLRGFDSTNLGLRAFRYAKFASCLRAQGEIDMALEAVEAAEIALDRLPSESVSRSVVSQARLRILIDAGRGEEVADQADEIMESLNAGVPPIQVVEVTQQLIVACASAGRFGEAIELWHTVDTAPMPGLYRRQLAETMADVFEAVGALDEAIACHELAAASESPPMGLLASTDIRLSEYVPHAYWDSIDRLESAEAELNRVAIEQQRLIAAVAHDLRGPLTSMRFVLDGDFAAVDPTVWFGLVDRIEPVLRSLPSEGDDQGPTMGLLAVRPVLESLVTEFGPHAASKQIDLDLKCDPDLRCVGDSDTVFRIVANLISNAIKFSGQGGSVSIDALAAGPNAVDIHVADDGPGFDPAKTEELFGWGARSAAQPTGGETTSGLGLHIARRLAGELGGEVRAFSVGPTLGSVFSLILRRHAAVTVDETYDRRHGNSDRRSSAR